MFPQRNCSFGFCGDREFRMDVINNEVTLRGRKYVKIKECLLQTEAEEETKSLSPRHKD